MNGRFLKLSIRCARRIGRRERVKFADEKRASVERGGRPCLMECQQVTRKDGQMGIVLHQICQAQGMQRLARQAGYVVVGDCDRAGRM
jgi:methylphosphotriester-DNA--protein-cysteine methyltransferase